MGWVFEYYNDEVQQQLLSMSSDLQARYLHITERMAKQGPNLGMPYTRALGEGLFEIRLQGQETIGRVFFCLLRGRHILILHCFVKKTQKTPQRHLALARRRMKEVT